MKAHNVLMVLGGGLIGAAVVAAALVWGPSVLETRGGEVIGHAAAEHGGHDSLLPETTTLYTCGMHPQVLRHEPGQCPICSMELVPKRRDAVEALGLAADAPGVRVPRTFLQNFAVRTAVVERGPLPVSIRTVGALAHNEESLVSVNTKFGGWIEKAHVNNIGESVVEGDVLFDIYSPELVATQREYLAAGSYVARLVAGGADPDAIARAEALLEATRERLRNWDISDAEIARLEQAGTAPRTVRFFAPASGLVVAKSGDSLEGMRVDPGMTVLKIADHSTLLAEARFFEEDLRHVQEGSEAVIEADAFPGRRWNGTILFFRSAVDPDTRALTAFVQVDNADLALRPMMYVDVSVRAGGAADAILVPAESVLHSGERSVVIVAQRDGGFEPREVALGLAAAGKQEVVSGLSPGERVVTASQFLIDSESNLKAAMAQLLRGSEGGEDSAPTPHMHHH